MVEFKKIIYFAIILFTLSSFDFRDTNPNAYWQEQSMPNLNGRRILDMVFTDSLTGFACTDGTSSSTAYILKTTNGGYNWSIVLERFNTAFNCFGIADENIIYVSSTPDSLFKTTDGGNNWSGIFLNGKFSKDIHIINKDTLWLASNIEFDGGVYISTNGGINWQNKFSLFGSNPSRIYFYNKDTGFIARDNTVNSWLRKTTDGGESWTLIQGATGFGRMYFTDNLTGWKNVGFDLEKTTDGGLNWFRVFSQGGSNPVYGVRDYKVLNKDTIWACGGNINLGNLQFRGLVYKTTNGGINWRYQIPDTNIIIGSYERMDFINQKTGWCYDDFSGNGIHTLTGGDTSSYPVTDIKHISTEIPEDYELKQNYPNPFNPLTTIGFSVKKQKSYISIKVYNIKGQEITSLVNNSLNPGEYVINFDGNNLSSGIYFYTLYADNIPVQTRKMILLK